MVGAGLAIAATVLQAQMRGRQDTEGKVRIGANQICGESLGLCL
jgi:hypothetical protein